MNQVILKGAYSKTCLNPYPLVDAKMYGLSQVWVVEIFQIKSGGAFLHHVLVLGLPINLC
jgi:hypothetical protein